VLTPTSAALPQAAVQLGQARPEALEQCDAVALLIFILGEDLDLAESILGELGSHHHDA
jgi:hypothetical protein